jgi:LysM repeat protein
MTATGDAPPSLDPAREPAPGLAPSTSRAVYQVCPFLQGESGGWRSLQPTRDHRCAATQPAAEPSVTKQRDLCLRPAHVTCATYQAARALEQGEDPDPRVEAGLWPTARQSVLALRAEPAGVGPISTRAGRTIGQGALAALIVGAFLVLAIARTTPSDAPFDPPGSFAAAAAASQPAFVPAPGSGAPSSAAPVDASADPSSSAAGPSTSPDAAPTPSGAAPSPSGDPGPSPTAGAPLARYTVKGGDTLSSIAIAHGISVRQLRKANGIEGTMIRPGQELLIPTSS